MRKDGYLVIHTREGHRPDLSDCPPSKLARGRLSCGIGDAGPMGRILVQGSYGHDIIDELKEPTRSRGDRPRNLGRLRPAAHGRGGRRDAVRQGQRADRTGRRGRQGLRRLHRLPPVK